MSDYSVSVPEGVSGSWRVERFTVAEQDVWIHNMKSPGRDLPPGTYTRLTHRGAVVMSDVPAEIRDHMEAIRRAAGHILIAGLGLGMVLQACLRKSQVEHVTVVEKSPNVIALVAPHYQTMFPERLTVVQADILEWQPPKGVRFGMAWYDIWSDICTDNLPQMTRLKRRFAQRVVWQGCWSESLCRYHKRREARSRYW